MTSSDADTDSKLITIIIAIGLHALSYEVADR